MNVEEFNSRIREIWKMHSRTDIPLEFRPELKDDPEILFIGINPSKRKNTETKTPKDSLEEERKVRQNKDDTYFKLFWSFTDNWEHIDLFFVRGNQDNLKKEVIRKENKKNVELNDFGKKQLEVSLGLLNKIKPRVIIVNNALASKILKKELKMDEWDKEKGYHIYNGIPIFFSGILSGQRALDVNSRERLGWHVKKALASHKY